MVSVIVPVYNVKEYLDKCIESISRQTYTNIEIVLIDDGSTDGSSEICDYWAKKDSRVIVIHKENRGVSAARNTGIEIARGEYLCFVDSDDYIEPDLCLHVMEYFLDPDVDVVVFNACMMTEKSDILGITENMKEGRMSKEEALLSLMKGKINHYAWNKVYRRNVFSGVVFPEGRVWEDVATCYKIFMNSRNVYFCNEILYNYIQRKGSIVHNIGAKVLQDIFLARYEAYVALKDEYPTVEKDAFSWAVLSARRFYDRSLWEEVDNNTLKQCMSFLSEHKEKIIRSNLSLKLVLFFELPKVYVFLRKSKHICGNIVKRINKRMIS